MDLTFPISSAASERVLHESDQQKELRITEMKLSFAECISALNSGVWTMISPLPSESAVTLSAPFALGGDSSLILKRRDYCERRSDPIVETIATGTTIHVQTVPTQVTQQLITLMNQDRETLDALGIKLDDKVTYGFVKGVSPAGIPDLVMLPVARTIVERPTPTLLVAPEILAWQRERLEFAEFFN